MYFYDKKNSQLEDAGPSRPSKVSRLSGYTLQSRHLTDKPVQTSLKSEPLSYRTLQKRESFFHWRIARNVYTLLLLVAVGTVVYQFAQDARDRIAVESRQRAIKARICESEYIDNDCDMPKPALRQYCLERKDCMTDDPNNSTNRLKHTLLVIIEIFNSAVSETGIRSLIVLAAGTVLLFVLAILARFCEPAN